MPQLLIYCDGGFGNRYNALISGLAAAEVLGYHPEIYWPINNWCEAEYSELFGDRTHVNTENLIDLKDNAKDWLVLSHDLRNAEYLDVPFISVYGFTSEVEFTEFCRKDGRDVFYYPALVPPWISQEKLKNVSAQLLFHPELYEAAELFIKEYLSGEFYGIHLRRTDLVLGYTDAEVGEIVARHKEQKFFVCSDSADSEKIAAQYPNVQIRDKHSYVERQLSDKGWTDITLDTSKRAYHSNIRRNSQSVRDAVIDLLILARSVIVGKSASTFLNVARFIKGLQNNNNGSLPDIDVIPIEESFRKVAVGVLDIMQAISAAQQLWNEKQYEKAVALLRLWLKRPNSSHQHVVYFNLGVYLQNLGSLNEAEAYLRQSVYLQPSFLQGHFQLGLLLEKLNRPEESVTQWLNALSAVREASPADRELRELIVSNVCRLTSGHNGA